MKNLRVLKMGVLKKRESVLSSSNRYLLMSDPNKYCEAKKFSMHYIRDRFCPWGTYKTYNLFLELEIGLH